MQFFYWHVVFISLNLQDLPLFLTVQTCFLLQVVEVAFLSWILSHLKRGSQRLSFLILKHDWTIKNIFYSQGCWRRKNHLDASLKWTFLAGKKGCRNTFEWKLLDYMQRKLWNRVASTSNDQINAFNSLYTVCTELLHMLHNKFSSVK